MINIERHMHTPRKVSEQNLLFQKASLITAVNLSLKDGRRRRFCCGESAGQESGKIRQSNLYSIKRALGTLMCIVRLNISSSGEGTLRQQ